MFVIGKLPSGIMDANLRVDIYFLAGRVNSAFYYKTRVSTIETSDRVIYAFPSTRLVHILLQMIVCGIYFLENAD